MWGKRKRKIIQALTVLTEFGGPPIIYAAWTFFAATGATQWDNQRYLVRREEEII